MMRPTLALTIGDPAGIGPEIVVKALSDRRLADAARLRVFGEPTLFRRACERAEVPLPPDVLVPVDSGPVPADFREGASSAFGGRVAAGAVAAAARAALAGDVDAIVTAPLSKVSLAAAGVPHPGHTEYLAELAGVDSVAMMFVAGDLRLTLATIHVALRDVASRLTVPGLLETIRLTRDALVSYAGIADPRLAVLGLNPHASEEGRFGDEEARVLSPAIGRACTAGWRVSGPFPADSFFFRHRDEYDAIVAMYHDQGLIPVKLLGAGRAVNVTLGLPFLRTSVDHGTAFDIAGRGVASADSLLEAAHLAIRWCRAAPRARPPA
jgi:4-hydroxythreonine-4-phosphate dehydrogenase